MSAFPQEWEAMSFAIKIWWAFKGISSNTLEQNMPLHLCNWKTIKREKKKKTSCIDDLHSLPTYQSPCLLISETDVGFCCLWCRLACSKSVRHVSFLLTRLIGIQCHCSPISTLCCFHGNLRRNQKQQVKDVPLSQIAAPVPDKKESWDKTSYICALRENLKSYNISQLLRGREQIATTTFSMLLYLVFLLAVLYNTCSGHYLLINGFRYFNYTYHQVHKIKHTAKQTI